MGSEMCIRDRGVFGPLLEVNQVTSEFDYYANKLRMIDAAIQHLNWTTDISVDDKVWIDFSNSKKDK